MSRTLPDGYLQGDNVIVRNSARCRKCGDEIESFHRHDMRWCSCGAIAVDGGRAYMRRAGEPEDFEDTSIVEETT